MAIRVVTFQHADQDGEILTLELHDPPSIRINGCRCQRCDMMFRPSWDKKNLNKKLELLENNGRGVYYPGTFLNASLYDLFNHFLVALGDHMVTRNLMIEILDQETQLLLDDGRLFPIPSTGREMLGYDWIAVIHEMLT